MNWWWLSIWKSHGLLGNKNKFGAEPVEMNATELQWKVKQKAQVAL